MNSRSRLIPVSYYNASQEVRLSAYADILLYQNGYPPEWDEEVFEKVMEQAENFKKYND